MENFTSEEVWMMCAASFFGGIMFMVILSAGLFVFDKFFWKPFRNQRKPLHYDVKRKL